MKDAIVAGLGIVRTDDTAMACLAHKIMHQTVFNGGLGGTEFLAAAVLLWCEGLVFFAVCHGSFPE